MADTPTEEPNIKRKLATMLLILRDRGFTFGYWYRQQAKGYVALFLLIGLGMAWWAMFNFQPGIFLMAGTLLGVLLRDLGIARQQKRVWPIQQDFIDWDKVKRAAGDDPLGLS